MACKRSVAIIALAWGYSLSSYLWQREPLFNRNDSNNSYLSKRTLRIREPVYLPPSCSSQESLLGHLRMNKCLHQLFLKRWNVTITNNASTDRTESLLYSPAKLMRFLCRKENLNVPHYNTPHAVVNPARFCGLDSVHTSCGNKWYHLTKSWPRVKMKTLRHVIYGVGVLLSSGCYFFKNLYCIILVRNFWQQSLIQCLTLHLSDFHKPLSIALFVKKHRSLQTDHYS